EPGHFHAALTLGTPHPNVREEIFVYAPPGQELDDFLALIDAFNRRAESLTAWKPVVRAGDRSLDRLIADRPGDVVILAGRNDRKMAMMRRLHDAGFHVLADKPWLAGPDGLDDLRHTLSGGPLAVETNAGRLLRLGAVTAALAARWDLSGPSGGGDTHRSVIRGTRAEIRVDQGAATDYRRRLLVVPRGEATQIRAALGRALAKWQDEFPGLAVSEAGSGWEISAPPALASGHESHFPLVLADFLALVEGGRWPPGLAADTLAKYTLLAHAS